VPLPAARPSRYSGGWLARGQLSTPADVAVYPQQVPATTIDDHGNQITAITASKRGALAVTYTRGDGLTVQALTAHLKSKLLTFPGRDSQQPRFETRDEAERARFGLYGLHQRAAEAVTIRAWATDQLQGHGQERHVVVCGDLNDTPQAATTQVLLGRPVLSHLMDLPGGRPLPPRRPATRARPGQAATPRAARCCPRDGTRPLHLCHPRRRSGPSTSAAPAAAGRYPGTVLLS
jgi:hypothetical protein